MIGNVNYGSSLPTATTSAGTFTGVANDLNRSVRRDLTASPNTPKELQLLGEVRNNLVRRVANVSERFNPDSGVDAVDTHEIRAQFTVTYDKRYASASQIKGVVAALLTSLLFKESESASATVDRLIDGEM